SSAMFDYAILERPIHFLAPDIEAYGAGRDLYEPYDTLTGGMHHRDWPSLLAALRDGRPYAADSEGRVIARRVAEYARNNTEPDVCQRIVETILGELSSSPSSRQQGG
ncbi:MAG: CDP-glycerol glycerophosphotransferase family protein, partial [Chloroflexota bacterium]|nr:CDP-glycerol glycerophosphotransferase family protein [Chloroflexota bacterium]